MGQQEKIFGIWLEHTICCQFLRLVGRMSPVYTIRCFVRYLRIHLYLYPSIEFFFIIDSDDLRETCLWPIHSNHLSRKYSDPILWKIIC